MTIAEHTDPKDLPRLTYSNINADLTGIHAYFDAEFPVFKDHQLGQSRPNFIGGKDDADGKPYDVLSPVDHDLKLATLVSPSDAAIDRAVAAARKALPVWSAMSPAARAEKLKGAAAYIRDHRFSFGMGLVLEVGKSRTEAMGETEEAIDLIEYYSEQLLAHDGWKIRLKSVGDEAVHDVLRPFGVFAVISPFNFPVALATSMISAALLMGNTVVFKPTGGAAFSGPLLSEAFRAAGLPDGVFNFIAGDRDVGEKLTNAAIDGIAFTGSNAVGMSLVRKHASGPYMKPVVAELGGKNAAFVCASADIDMAAKAVARAAFGLSGQKCSACSKVYVARSVEKEFLEKLVAFTKTLAVGNPEDKSNFLGPVINEASATRFVEAVNLAGKDHVLVGGERLRGGIYDKGAYVAPTVVSGLPADHDLHFRELFVPFVAVQAFDDLGAAIIDANRVAYGLTSGIYTTNETDRDLFMDKIEAGVIYINRPSTATTGAWPGYQGFCGWKGSGVSGKGGLGPHYLTQFAREQSRTVHW